MLTVITESTVKPGRESDWDAAYFERAADAQSQEGWVALQLLVPEDDPRRRVVVGTWQDREAWQRWHGTEAFQATRPRLDDATEQHGDERWFRVATEERTDEGGDTSANEMRATAGLGPDALEAWRGTEPATDSDD